MSGKSFIWWGTEAMIPAHIVFDETTPGTEHEITIEEGGSPVCCIQLGGSDAAFFDTMTAQGFKWDMVNDSYFKE